MQRDLIIKITPDELNEAVLSWEKTKGENYPSNINVTVIIDKTAVDLTPSPAPVVEPPTPKATPVKTAPAPSASDVIVSTVATIFALGYKGEPDPGDDGKGAFKDPATGAPYDTKKVVGVSVPIPILWDTIGKVDYDAVSNGHYTVGLKQVRTGKIFNPLHIVDLGPGESETVNGKKVHALIVSKDGTHYLDRTYALCQLMESTDNEQVEFWINDMTSGSPVPMPMKGLDAPKVTI